MSKNGKIVVEERSNAWTVKDFEEKNRERRASGCTCPRIHDLMSCHDAPVFVEFRNGLLTLVCAECTGTCIDVRVVGEVA